MTWTKHGKPVYLLEREKGVLLSNGGGVWDFVKRKWALVSIVGGGLDFASSC